ncbi:MAG TPA: hypothetical protein VIV12_15175 [Streptosporangiaceae bacterium]
MGVHASGDYEAIAAATLGSMRTVTEKNAPASRMAQATDAPQRPSPSGPPWCRRTRLRTPSRTPVLAVADVEAQDLAPPVRAGGSHAGCD